jgi:hypothetical protein
MALANSSQHHDSSAFRVTKCKRTVLRRADVIKISPTSVLRFESCGSENGRGALGRHVCPATQGALGVFIARVGDTA